MKKILFTIICLFSFISISKAELISNESIAVSLGGYFIPTYWGVSGNSTTSVSLKLNFEDPLMFEEIGAQYLVLSVCTNGSLDNWLLTNASKNNSWFDEYFEVYNTEKRCTTDGGFQGTMWYAQFLIGKYQVQDGLGVQVSSNLHLKNNLSYAVQYSFKKGYLSTDDYLATFNNDKIGDAIQDTNDKIDSTNSKLDQAENTRKGIWETIKGIGSSILNLPSLIWNAIKGGFEAITGAIKGLFDFFKDDEVDTNEGNSFFSSFEDTDHGGISGVVTAPLTFINKISGKCSPLGINVLGADVSLPCGDTLFWNKPEVANFRNTWNVLFGGGILYALLLKLLKVIENLKNPDDSRIEVMKL